MVKMRARAWTDGNPDDIVVRIFTAVLDPDLISLAKTQEEAIRNFCTGAPYIGEVLNLDYFEIGGEKYTPDYWKQ